MSEENIMFTPESFVRKPIYVQAIRVTTENMQHVATWCGGRVHNVSDGTTFIKVLGYKSKMIPRTKAFIGDWVLSGDKGFRVYTDSAFEKSFSVEPNPPVEFTGAWPGTHDEALKTIQSVFKENA